MPVILRSDKTVALVLSTIVSVSYRSNEGFPRLKKQANPIPLTGFKTLMKLSPKPQAHLYTHGIRYHRFSDGRGQNDLDIPGNDLTDGPNGFNEREIETNFQFINGGKVYKTLMNFNFSFTTIALLWMRFESSAHYLASLSVPPSFIPLILTAMRMKI